MHTAILSSGRDMLLIAIPFVIVLVAGIFRLDQIIAAPKRKASQRRQLSGMNEDGKPIMSDPDGKLSGKPHSRR